MSNGGVPEISHSRLTSDPLTMSTGEGFLLKTGGSNKGRKEHLESTPKLFDQQRVYRYQLLEKRTAENIYRMGKTSLIFWVQYEMSLHKGEY